MGIDVLLEVSRDAAWELSAGSIERESALTLSPGLRVAFDLSPGQVVVGAAAPVLLGRRAKLWGVSLSVGGAQLPEIGAPLCTVPALAAI
jgi:hypothetical protein